METKLIFQGDLARYLLKKGFTIVDVKPKKENPESSIFVFRLEKGLIEELKKWKSK